MNAQQYAEAQAEIQARVTKYVMQFSTFFVNPALNVTQWLGFLQLLFPEVERARFEAASVARAFYDSERFYHNPELPQHKVYLEQYEFPQFVRAMEPTRKKITVAQSPKDAVVNVVMHTVREVEDAGREQIVRAVEADASVFTEYQIPETRMKAELPEVREYQVQVDEVKLQRTVKEIVAERLGKAAPPVEKPKNLTVKPTGPVRGWARVATGKETCAWCLMLISRGPVYLSAKGAGLDLHDAGAAAGLSEGKDVSEWMNEWHIGCDCKVVPVYDKYDWVGRDAALQAEQLWITASREARQVLEDEPGKKYYSFKSRMWLPTTLNREAVNALRRRLETGEISTSEFSALAA